MGYRYILAVAFVNNVGLSSTDCHFISLNPLTGYLLAANKIMATHFDRIPIFDRPKGGYFVACGNNSRYEWRMSLAIDELYGKLGMIWISPVMSIRLPSAVCIHTLSTTNGIKQISSSFVRLIRTNVVAAI
jgi:hypothetical protein